LFAYFSVHLYSCLPTCPYIHSCLSFHLLIFFYTCLSIFAHSCLPVCLSIRNEWYKTFCVRNLQIFIKSWGGGCPWQAFPA
jgi:hypothetical protein